MLNLLSHKITSFPKRVEGYVVGHNEFPFCQTGIPSLEHWVNWSGIPQEVPLKSAISTALPFKGEKPLTFTDLQISYKPTWFPVKHFLSLGKTTKPLWGCLCDLPFWAPSPSFCFFSRLRASQELEFSGLLLLSLDTLPLTGTSSCILLTTTSAIALRIIHIVTEGAIVVWV